MFVLQVFFWVLFIYGFLSLVQDIFNEFTYKKINHDMKIVIFASKLEEKLENYILELESIKRNNFGKQIILIDLDENDNIDMIYNKLENREVNVKLFSKEEGEKYISECFQNENISHL